MMGCADGWSQLHGTYTAMNPPQCVADSHQAWLYFLYDEYLSTTAISKYVASGKAADRLRALKWDTRATAEFGKWSSELHATAKRLDVHLPASMSPAN